MPAFLSSSAGTYITCNKSERVDESKTAKNTTSPAPFTLQPLRPLSLPNHDNDNDSSSSSSRRNIFDRAGKKYHVTPSHNKGAAALWSPSALPPTAPSSRVFNVVLGGTATNDDLLHIEEEPTSAASHEQHEQLKKQMMQQTYKHHVQNLKHKSLLSQNVESSSQIRQIVLPASTATSSSSDLSTASQSSQPVPVSDNEDDDNATPRKTSIESSSSNVSGYSSDTQPVANIDTTVDKIPDNNDNEEDEELELKDLFNADDNLKNQEQIPLSTTPEPDHQHPLSSQNGTSMDNKQQQSQPPQVMTYTTETQLSPMTPLTPLYDTKNTKHTSYQNVPPPPIIQGAYSPSCAPPQPSPITPPSNYTDTPPVSPASSHEGSTLHAQSFILALAFFAVWSPQNLMAPNLTQMATFFHFGPSQRDLYLGANIAFATGVLSLPVSALIGFFADIVSSRKKLFAATVFVGGVASICTGLSTTYSALYFARFVCGGCMSGSVPVAFSLLGDLFDTKDRNAASSGLTAMMGAGIIAGQVYAGVVGDNNGWQFPFYVSGCMSFICSILVMHFVDEPIRGGKEKVLQDMIAKGTKYDRKLTLAGFIHAMCKNQSNFIIMVQGFFSSIPWGIIFVFLNDYLSQEQNLSVTDATMLVLVFGVGCAAGGVLGGYWGQLCMNTNRSYLPVFMAVTTFLGIFPFLALLDGTFHSASFAPCLYAFLGGCIESLPSVNVRPCLINVNPPETRGAALTAANLIINLARGAGPSFVTMMAGIWGVNRCFSFNVLLMVFWTITSIQLALLAFTLPHDQDAMEAELAQYAEKAIRAANDGGDASALSPRMSIDSYYGDDTDADTLACDESIVSIEDRMTSFDTVAARESIKFYGDAIREMGEELKYGRGLRGVVACGGGRNGRKGGGKNDDDSPGNMDRVDEENEETPLLKNHGGKWGRGIHSLGTDQRRALWRDCPDGADGAKETETSPNSYANLVRKAAKRGNSTLSDLQDNTPALPLFVERGHQSIISVLEDSQVGTLWEVGDESDVERKDEEEDEEMINHLRQFGGLVTL